MTEIEEKCLYKANKLIQLGISNLDLFELTDLLIKLETEKNEKNLLSDKNIDYNDEIVSIEECGVKETIDISVSGDNLFYCNGILTKNSFGLPATADFMFALISTEELEKENKIMVKQLKNRYNDPTTHKRFVVGIDRSRMKLYNVDNAENLVEEKEFDFDEMMAQSSKDTKSKFTNFIL
jgi:hypothetical protein